MEARAGVRGSFFANQKNLDRCNVLCFMVMWRIIRLHLTTLWISSQGGWGGHHHSTWCGWHVECCSSAFESEAPAHVWKLECGAEQRKQTQCVGEAVWIYVCLCVCLQAVLDPIESSVFGRAGVTHLTLRALLCSKYISFTFPFSPFFPLHVRSSHFEVHMTLKQQWYDIILLSQ